MNIDDLHLIDREAAMPVYAFVSTEEMLDSRAVPSDYEPGRIIYSPTLLRTGLEDKLGPNDIVYVPLYGRGDPGSVCDGTGDRCDGYDDNMGMLERIAPRVRAILLGNASSELSFKHLFLDDGSCTRQRIVDEMCRFVDETSEIVRAAGGAPAYGPIDWDCAMDAYFCDGQYRDHCNGRGIIQIIFCGFHLFGIGTTIPQREHQAFWPLCPRQEGPPWPELTEYIRGYDHIITGLNFISGLRDGNDIILSDHGFDSGLCGALGNPI